MHYGVRRAPCLHSVVIYTVSLRRAAATIFYIISAADAVPRAAPTISI